MQRPSSKLEITSGGKPNAMSDPVAATRVVLTRNTRVTALIVACAFFMQDLDSTVISTALPAMARAFGAEPTHMNVALTSYMLSVAVFIPASGWVADRFGARNVFRAAIALFTLGSVLCGRADSLLYLVLARIVQGAGGAMMMPVGRLVLLRTVTKAELVSAMAWMSTPALLGPVLGPPVGGFIVTYFNWHWIFDINVPVGIAGVILVTVFIEDVREPRGAKFDWVGLALSGSALAVMMGGLETIGRGVLPVPVSAGLIGTGLLISLGYVVHARLHPAPIIDLSLLRVPTFMASVTSGALFRIGIGAIPFLLPMMLQLGFGLSAVQSGLITFASSIGALAMKPVTTTALRYLGFRDTLFYNSIIIALFLAMMAAFRPSWPMSFIYAALICGGFFRSLQFTALNALAYSEIPTSRTSRATSFYAAMQQVSATLGVSAAAGALTAVMGFGGHELPSLGDFSAAFLTVSTISLAAAPVLLLMPRDSGLEASGFRGRR
jgi:EmrB/QacA subfamily drug resistance transporter